MFRIVAIAIALALAPACALADTPTLYQQTPACVTLTANPAPVVGLKAGNCATPGAGTSVQAFTLCIQLQDGAIHALSFGPCAPAPPIETIRAWIPVQRVSETICLQVDQSIPTLVAIALGAC